MRQRIAIAMALLAEPRAVDRRRADHRARRHARGADHPSAARAAARDSSGSILFISHNLGVIAELCDYVVMLYAGEVVEQGSVREIFHGPQHPYTAGAARMRSGAHRPARRDLPTIPGDVPDLSCDTVGCVFAPRCSKAVERCRDLRPEDHQVSDTQSARCHFAAGNPVASSLSFADAGAIR